MSNLTAPILVYATRYALGRRTGAAQDVEHAIAANLDVLKADEGCREAIIREVLGALWTQQVGDKCDSESWWRTLERLTA